MVALFASGSVSRGVAKPADNVIQPVDSGCAKMALHKGVTFGAFVFDESPALVDEDAVCVLRCGCLP